MWARRVPSWRFDLAIARLASRCQCWEPTAKSRGRSERTPRLTSADYRDGCDGPAQVLAALRGLTCLMLEANRLRELPAGPPEPAPPPSSSSSSSLVINHPPCNPYPPSQWHTLPCFVTPPLSHTAGPLKRPPPPSFNSCKRNVSQHALEGACGEWGAKESSFRVLRSAQVKCAIEL